MRTSLLANLTLLAKKATSGDVIGWGLLYVYAPKHKKDTDKAFKIFVKNCDGRHAASCFVPSWFYAGGISATKDAKKSLDMITKSCDMGYGEGCAELARAYARSQNAQQDVKKRANFHRKGLPKRIL